VLSALAAVEVLTHRGWYNASVAECVDPLRNEPGIIMTAYAEIRRDVTTLGRSCDINVVLALSCVIGLPVTTFWPPLCGSLSRSPLSQCLVGRDVDRQLRPVDLLWTTTENVKPEGTVPINHFVPLMHSSVQAPVSDVIIVADDVVLSDEGIASQQVSAERCSSKMTHTSCLCQLWVSVLLLIYCQTVWPE